MMNNRNNVEEMLRMIFEGETPKEEKKAPSEPPRKTEGFESLVSEEEFDAIIDIKEAIDKFIDIHNKNSLKAVLVKHSPYQMIQYSVLSNICDDLQKEFLMMYGIHTFDKATIDELVADSPFNTVEEYEKYFAMQMLHNKLFG